jgi:hypothetical protein
MRLPGAGRRLEKDELGERQVPVGSEDGRARAGTALGRGGLSGRHGLLLSSSSDPEEDLLFIQEIEEDPLDEDGPNDDDHRPEGAGAPGQAAEQEIAGVRKKSMRRLPSRC